MSGTSAAARPFEPPSIATRRKGRVRLALAVLLAVLSGAMMLFAASRQWWIEQTPRIAPLPSLREQISGTDVAPWSAAAGLVSLSGAAALLATRRLGRLAVGVFILGAGAAAILAGAQGLSVDAHAGTQRIDMNLAWPVATAIAGVFGVASGVLTVAGFRGWSAQSAGLGARYEAPSKHRRVGDESDDRPDPASLWDALDRGVDPTLPPAPGRSAGA